MTKTNFKASSSQISLPRPNYTAHWRYNYNFSIKICSISDLAFRKSVYWSAIAAVHDAWICIGFCFGYCDLLPKQCSNLVVCMFKLLRFVQSFICVSVLVVCMFKFHSFLEQNSNDFNFIHVSPAATPSFPPWCS